MPFDTLCLNKMREIFGGKLGIYKSISQRLLSDVEDSVQTMQNSETTPFIM